MNSQRTPFFVAVVILLIISVVVYNQNNSLSKVSLEKDQLIDEINIQSAEIQELETEITVLSSTIDYLNETLSSFLQSAAMEKEIEKSTFLRVIPPRKKVTYTFEEKMNFTYSVNYSLPESGNVVFSVLDSDKKTVLGYAELELVGQGIETITVEIPLPGVPLDWEVHPSVYWLVDGAPRYSVENWCQKALITIIDATPGHTQSSCSDESAICHSG